MDNINEELMNMYSQQQLEQPIAASYQQSYTTKPKGLNLYQIKIFEVFNPKNATVAFMVNCKNGLLSILMAPAIPNNPAMNVRGPVPPGVKVYDYSQKVISNFTDVEVIDFVEFLKSKFRNTESRFKDLIENTNKRITEIQAQLIQYNQVEQLVQLLPQINNQLELLKSQNSQFMNSGGFDNNTNQFSIYRKFPGSPDRAWNFNYDMNYNMLHINLLSGANKVRTSLSDKMAIRLLNALESYVSNITMVNMLSEISHNLSKTLAINNLFAPNKNQLDSVD